MIPCTVPALLTYIHIQFEENKKSSYIKHYCIQRNVSRLFKIEITNQFKGNSAQRKRLQSKLPARGIHNNPYSFPHLSAKSFYGTTDACVNHIYMPIGLTLHEQWFNYHHYLSWLLLCFIDKLIEKLNQIIVVKTYMYIQQ